MKLEKAPSTLSSQGQSIWRRILEEWDLDYQARLLLKLTLEQHDLYLEAIKAVSEQGVLITSPSGNVRENPACDVARDARNGFLAAWTKSRLDVEPPGEIRRPGGGEF